MIEHHDYHHTVTVTHHDFKAIIWRNTNNNLGISVFNNEDKRILEFNGTDARNDASTVAELLEVIAEEPCLLPGEEE